MSRTAPPGRKHVLPTADLDDLRELLDLHEEIHPDLPFGEMRYGKRKRFNMETRFGGGGAFVLAWFPKAARVLVGDLVMANLTQALYVLRTLELAITEAYERDIARMLREYRQMVPDDEDGD